MRSQSTQAKTPHTATGLLASLRARLRTQGTGALSAITRAALALAFLLTPNHRPRVHRRPDPGRGSSEPALTNRIRVRNATRRRCPTAAPMNWSRPRRRTGPRSAWRS